jgi:hypothetical protein
MTIIMPACAAGTVIVILYGYLAILVQEFACTNLVVQHWQVMYQHLSKKFKIGTCFFKIGSHHKRKEMKSKRLNKMHRWRQLERKLRLKHLLKHGGHSLSSERLSLPRHIQLEEEETRVRELVEEGVESPTSWSWNDRTGKENRKLSPQKHRPAALAQVSGNNGFRRCFQPLQPSPLLNYFSHKERRPLGKDEDDLSLNPAPEHQEDVQIGNNGLVNQTEMITNSHLSNSKEAPNC